MIFSRSEISTIAHQGVGGQVVHVHHSFTDKIGQIAVCYSGCIAEHWISRDNYPLKNTNNRRF